MPLDPDAFDPDAFADAILDTIDRALASHAAEVARVKAQVASWETRWCDLGLLRERIAVLEVRPSVPGPPGDPGPPGKDGRDGKDGDPGLAFKGVYQDGQAYGVGHLVTWGGSSWHCNEPTTTKPGDGSKAWTLMVKRGRDGKDGVDAPGALPVVKVR